MEVCKMLSDGAKPCHVDWTWFSLCRVINGSFLIECSCHFCSSSIVNIVCSDKY